MFAQQIEDDVLDFVGDLDQEVRATLGNDVGDLCLQGRVDEEVAQQQGCRQRRLGDLGGRITFQENSLAGRSRIGYR